MKAVRFHVIAFSVIFSAIGIFAFFGVDAAEAVDVPQYQQLENIPGTAADKIRTFPDYVQAIYNLALWIIGISAMFMLTVGGFMYLTSAGNTSSASSAKGVIKDALVGLVLGLSAWLILHTINPELTDMNFSGLATGTSTPPTAGTAVVPEIPGGTEFAKSGDCKDASGAVVSPDSNIAEAKAGNSMTMCYHGCKAAGAAPCTGKVNPSAGLLSALKNVDGYTVTSIAGGSHAADSAHYSGKGMDVTPVSTALRDKFIRNGALANNPNGSGTMCETVGGEFVADCVGADHIHVRFP